MAKDIELITKFPVAEDSPDYIMPWGTRKDNSINLRFNSKLYKLYNRQINVLDLGCSGGGFVKSLIDDGNIAVGLEGSDFSKKNQRASWGIIRNNLFTADISKDFSILVDKKPMKFDIITMWEVIEHIKESDLASLFKNIKKHLKEGGLFIISTTSVGDSPEGKELHQTIKSRGWWIKKITELSNFNQVKPLYPYFNSQYVRGREQNEITFNLIFSNGPFKNRIPRLSIRDKILDKWFGSRTQLDLKYIIDGNSK